MRLRSSAVLVSLLLLTVFGTGLVFAFNGGATKATAVALPITPPVGAFIGDNTGLSTPPVTGAQRRFNVTWWTWTPDVTMTMAVRATSIEPNSPGWDNTLEVWAGPSPSVSLVTENDDSYGLDAQVTFTAVAGVRYVIGLGGFSANYKGTATIRFFELPTPAPTAVAGTPGNTAVLVTWSMPTANEQSVETYLITRYIGGVQNGSPSFVQGKPPATTVNVSGLVNGTAYTFKVQAVNSVGAGPLSDPSAAVTPLGAPGAPTGVSAVAGNAQATVSFTPPVNNGGSPITSYTVLSVAGGFSATGAASPIVVTGLTNGVAYSFRVRATNSLGAGIQSGASAPVTPIAPAGGSQAITFAPLAGKTFGDAPFSVAATGGASGNPVTFSSTTLPFCTVSGSMVTLVAAGTCTIAGNQAGNATYTAAPTVTQSFTVAPSACASASVGGFLAAARIAVPYAATLTTGGATSTATFVVTNGTLPAGLTLASDGAITGTPAVLESARFTVQVADGSCTASVGYTLNVEAARWLTTGAGAGGSAHVRSFDSGNAQITGALGSFLAEPPAFSGGVRVALGDVNGDGVVDVITGAGPGAAPIVRVFSGWDGVLVRSFDAFEPAFAGGVFVAAGDVNNDGIADIIVGSGEGHAPLVRVFDGPTGQQLTSPIGEFAPYAAEFPGGVHVAAGDVDGDGYADVITGPGPGGGPHVRVWNVRHVTGPEELAGFFAYDPAFSGGVFVAAGDVNGDGYADVVTGAGPGGGPHVRVWDVHNGTVIQSFFAYDPAFAGGVRVAAADVDGDGYADVITGAGPGGGPHVRVWAAGSGGALSELTGFFAYDPSFAGGVFVAAPALLHRMAIDRVSATVSVPGTVRIDGWALDEAAAPGAPNTVGVSAIHAWAYPVAGGAPLFAGATTPTDERPDVAGAFGGQFQWSGFHLDTEPLPSGSYDMVVYALGPHGLVAQRTVRATVP